MSSREEILAAVLQNQPSSTPLPDTSMFRGNESNIVRKYIDIFTSIGGTAFVVDSLTAVDTLIRQQFDVGKRFVTSLPALGNTYELISPSADPHTYEDAELAVVKADFSVAENGAVWLTEASMGQRIIPYICQHLAVIVGVESIVPTMHEAYEIIGAGSYGFGGFIGGPSKTADIEQALVLGAHGPLSMTVFLIN